MAGVRRGAITHILKKSQAAFKIIIKNKVITSPFGANGLNLLNWSRTFYDLGRPLTQERLRINMKMTVLN